MNAAFLLVTTAWLAGAEPAVQPAPAPVAASAPVYGSASGGCGCGSCTSGCGSCDTCCDSCGHHGGGLFSRWHRRGHGCGDCCASSCDTCSSCTTVVAQPSCGCKESCCGSGHGARRWGWHRPHEECGCESSCGSCGTSWGSCGCATECGCGGHGGLLGRWHGRRHHNCGESECCGGSSAPMAVPAGTPAPRGESIPGPKVKEMPKGERPKGGDETLNSPAPPALEAVPKATGTSDGDR